MTAKMKNNINLILALLIGVFVITLVFVAFSYVFNYQERIDESARNKTEASIEQDANSLEEYIYSITDIAREISIKASLCKTELAFLNTIKEYCISPEQGEMTEEEYSKALAKTPKCVRFVQNEKFYSTEKNENFSEAVIVRNTVAKLKDDNTLKVAGIAYDALKEMNLLSVVVPIYSSEYATAIVVYFPVTLLNYCDINDEITSFAAICDAANNTIITFKDSTASNTFITSAKDKMSFVSIESVKYSVGYKWLISSESNIKIVNAYQLNDVFSYETTFYHTLSVLIVFFAVVMVALVIFYIIKFIRGILLTRSELWNSKYNCCTYDGFLDNADLMLEQFKSSNFCIVVAEIRFYKYLLEQGGSGQVYCMKAVSNAIHRELNPRFECYGCDENGHFYMLCHFTNEKDLQKRLNVINEKCARNKIDSDHKLQLMYGACEVTKKHDVITTTSGALEALAKSIEYIGIRNFTMHVFTDDNDKLDKEYIEMNAEKALVKNDFKVFFQPKYNIAKNTVDGAEALMRWFIPDENRFYAPSAFLPVIESNGFISRVDIYVFEQVCAYLRKSLDAGERVYPVSVNVSRFTVAQANFVEKYTEIKKKYRIRNDLLWIEFTESSDLQDYTFMREIIAKLHENGFKCSLDDFGTGYSSYECLKMLELDEIKLDRFYIVDNLKTERDNLIVKSVIDLGHALKMKVTVEGVSEEETLKKLKEYGCEIIQGYLYSKPLPMADYISFINSAYHGAFE